MSTSRPRRRAPSPTAASAFEDLGGEAEYFRRRIESKSADFVPAAVDTVSGAELNREWLNKQGFVRPIFIPSREGLGMKIPEKAFSYGHIAHLLGPDYPIDVIDVATQTEERWKWTLGKWVKYMGAKYRSNTLNVISLEFSGTPLQQLVRSPRIVREIDWIDTVWPGRRHAAGSWTDFHVDFGGTSVWYHVHTGKKVFLFMPPTPSNLAAYEEWVSSPSQAETWLPDTASGCFQVELEAGNTLFIPSGWIHAVFTPVDSLVFGGNFMHGYQLDAQLRIFEFEMRAKVARKYRFPYYEHLQWYAAAFYLQFTRVNDFADTLRTLLRVSTSSRFRTEQDSSAEREAVLQKLAELGVSVHEIQGLPALLNTLAHLQRERRAVGTHASASVSSSTTTSSTTPATTTVTSDGSKKLRFKLSVKPKNPDSNTVNDGPATTTTAPTAPTTLPRIKGSIRAHELSGVDAEAAKLAAAVAAAVADDDFSVFPAQEAAREACFMANCSSPEAMLAELMARMDVTNPEYENNIAKVVSSPVSSTLAQHSDAASFAAHASTSTTATDTTTFAPATQDVPKTAIQSLPLSESVGGFGFYNGAIPSSSSSLLPAEDETAAAGEAYVPPKATRGTRKLTDHVGEDELNDILGSDSEGDESNSEDEAYKEEEEDDGAEPNKAKKRVDSDDDDDDLSDLVPEDEESDFSQNEEDELQDADDDLVVGERGGNEDDWTDVEETQENGEVKVVRRRRRQRMGASNGVSQNHRNIGGKSKRTDGLILDDEEKPKRKRMRRSGGYDVDVFDRLYDSQGNRKTGVDEQTSAAMNSNGDENTSRVLGASSKIRRIGAAAGTATQKKVQQTVEEPTFITKSHDNDDDDDDDEVYVAPSLDDLFEAVSKPQAAKRRDKEDASSALSTSALLGASSGGGRKAAYAFGKPAVTHIAVADELLQTSSNTATASGTKNYSTSAAAAGNNDGGAEDADNDDDDDGEVYVAADVYDVFGKPTTTTSSSAPKAGGASLLKDNMKLARSKLRR